MSEEDLSAAFAALANPTRRAILKRLTAGEKTVTELAEPFDITMPAITKHLQVLEQAKLIRRSREAQYRPSALNPTAFIEIDQWMDTYRQFFEESFERLDEYLSQLQTEEEGYDK